MSETLGDQEFVRIVTEVIRAEEEGIYTHPSQDRNLLIQDRFFELAAPGIDSRRDP